MPPKLFQLQNVIAHEGAINTITLGQRTSQVFATGGDDRILNLWAVGSNNPKATFGPFQSAITACKFNDTEEMVLCGNNGGTVMLFDLNKNRCVANWPAHHASVRGLAFHTTQPDLVLSVGIDGKLQVLNPKQKHPYQSYTAHKGPANHVSVSADGRLAATCGDDKTIRVFDLSSQRQIAKLEGNIDAVTCVEFHPTEPILISCGVDRSIRFFDLSAQKEIPVSFPLDSSPVDVVMFIPGESTAISASPDYLKVVGWEPPEFFEHFTLGLERVHDIAISNQLITIASSAADHALIHRIKLDALKPFSQRPSVGVNFIAGPGPAPVNKASRPTTPRLLDIAAMKEPKKKRTSPPVESSKRPTALQSPNESRDSGRVLSSKRSVSSDSQPQSEEEKMFRGFRKDRTKYMADMNEKFSRLTRIDDMINQFGLTKSLYNLSTGGDLGPEMLMVLRMKPEAVKLEHSAYVLQIAERVFDDETDLAITTIESMLQAFGKIVQATKAIPSRRSGGDPAFEERKKNSELFVETFRELAPKLRSYSSSSRSLNASTARELLDEWRAFLR